MQGTVETKEKPQEDSGVTTIVPLHSVCMLCLTMFAQDLTIQIDPHVTGYLKLPDLLDIMSRIIMERNYDAQIEDAFRLVSCYAL